MLIQAFLKYLNIYSHMNYENCYFNLLFYPSNFFKMLTSDNHKKNMELFNYHTQLFFLTLDSINNNL